jgi:hypothetical protein
MIILTVKNAKNRKGNLAFFARPSLVELGISAFIYGLIFF